jgi:signal peptidase I
MARGRASRPAVVVLLLLSASVVALAPFAPSARSQSPCSGVDELTFSGTSMRPTLHEGDCVTYQPTSISQVNIGDIVVYGTPCYSQDGVVIHRVVNITSQGLVTKGDNNPIADQYAGIATSPITQACLIGKVVSIAYASSTSNTTSATSTTSTNPTTTSTSTSSSTTSGGGGIPEFPLQLGFTLLATVVIVTSYVLTRRVKLPRL